MNMMRTEKISWVLGVQAGYQNINSGRDKELSSRIKIQELALELYKETGIYISTVVKSVEVIYNEDWGCPRSGEFCLEISTVYNPIYKIDAKKWKNTALKFANILKKEFGQETLTIEIKEIGLVYLGNES